MSIVLFQYRNVHFSFSLFPDIRKAQLVQGRSINLALSARGRKALAKVGLEEKLLEHGIPMRGRMLHDLKGRTQFVPYDPTTNQVHIPLSSYKHLNNYCYYRIPCIV